MTARRAAELFRGTFGTDPDVVASAPGRVNLIGEHTDYNGGDVLPMALELRTAVAIGASRESESRAVSEQESVVARFSAQAPVRSGIWSDYVVGVAHELRSLGVRVPELSVAVASDVPAGAGLSSSAALEVATARAISTLADSGHDTRQLARVAHRAEVEFVGLPCGIMDQFASALGQAGHALWLRCDTEELRLVPFAGTVLVFDTCTPRQLRTSEFQTRRAECQSALDAIRVLAPQVVHLARSSEEVAGRAAMSAVARRRANHVLSETRRVSQLVASLERQGTLADAGELLYASHRSLREDYECSSPELDWFVEQSRSAPGVAGARLTGAGWGGCAIAIGTESGLRAFAHEVASRYASAFGRAPRWWLSTASDGVRVDFRR